MSSAPTKRRKTSPTTAVPIDAPETTQKDSSAQEVRPAVTHHTSFQSPTKASLARSNPDVLSHVFNRSPTRSLQPPSSRRETEKRVFGLRDRKALRPSLTGSGSSATGGQLSVSFASLSPKRRSSAFQAPPRRVSRRAGTPEVETEAARGIQGQAALMPVRGNNPDEQLASELGSATRGSESHNTPRPSFLDEYGEPDLPPTPTELGLERRPERPTGLLSSPIARYEKRKRREGLRQSTLRIGDARISPENIGSEYDVPLAARKKKALRNDLEAQLERLKAEVTQLERWAKRTERPLDNPDPDSDIIENLISLLTTSNPSCAHISSLARLNPPPFSSLISSLLPFSARLMPAKSNSIYSNLANPFALKELADPKPYIKFFAPLDLTYSAKVITLSDADLGLTEIHDITLSAPSPFPRHLYKVPLGFTANLESQSILSISMSEDHSVRFSEIPPALNSWMKSRLANPLLRLDISGLCWGVCRYWEAAVSRARIWAKLKRKHESLTKGIIEAINEKETKMLKKSDLRVIIPHLERTTMLFLYGAKKQESKVLLSCPLILEEWTGEPQLKPEISIFIPDLAETKRLKVERDIKKLFSTLLKEGKRRRADTSDGEGEADAIVNATEGVMGVFFGFDILTARNNGNH